jgi:hypothetical protein
MMLSAGQFSPASLFAAGEQGAWYDPSDFSTMFQESTGVTPVTAVEQPVGLILDKSKGLVLGSELVTNGDFSNGTTGWTIANGATIAVSSGQFVVTNGIAAFGWSYASFTTVVGRTYRITGTVVGASTSWVFRVGDDATAGTNQKLALSGTTAGQSVSAYFVATATTTYVRLGLNNGTPSETATFDNISVKEIAGNHASQATSTSRPVLSARVNLLTYSEQFDNAAWQKLAGGTGVAPVVTQNYGTAPDGTSTADRVQFDLGATPSSATSRLFQNPGGTANSQAIWLKTTDGTTKTLYFPNASPSFKSITVTGTWTRFTGDFNGPQFQFGLTGPSGSGGAGIIQTDTTADILVWGADLRVTNDGVGIPAYQRIAAATNYDTSGYPFFLRFDGTDDSLATASIDFSATDKMSVFAGVRKLSDAATQIIAEFTTTWVGATGSFALYLDPTGSQYYASPSRGNAAANVSQVAVAPIAYAAPITNVLTATHDIAGDNSTLRANGTFVNTATGDKGSGNFANAILYLGRRAGSSLPYNGRLYSLIVRGAQSTDAQIASTETWVNGKTMAY